jgi:hypothetical protein
MRQVKYRRRSKMSRTYKVRRDSGHAGGVRKEWVLVNKRGAKKYQQMVNKRCRRLDKIAIAEGINEMIDDTDEAMVTLEELFDDWYEEDPFEDPEWYEKDPFESLEEEPEDDYGEESGDWLYWEEPEDW